MTARILLTLVFGLLGGCATFSGRATYELAETPAPESVIVYVDHQGWKVLDPSAWSIEGARTIAIRDGVPGSDHVRVAYDVQRAVASR